jgi:hypothetical protein
VSVAVIMIMSILSSESKAMHCIIYKSTIYLVLALAIFEYHKGVLHSFKALICSRYMVRMEEYRGRQKILNMICICGYECKAPSSHRDDRA